ncbi:phage tail protein [Nisaea sediminum]|uniref:phage tail protein n=1 Tax=Nisaea sediminum TaxID=2775867 RepID=UPI001D029373|nr:tail fiber protein [Nisaea sediminum]
MSITKLTRILSRATVAAAAVTFVLATPDAEAGCGPGDSVYIGSVCTTAANFCPRGYFEASGQLLPIEQHQALFSLLGCEWGGDCRTTFKLPDMRGRAAIGTGAGPGLTPIELGQWRGAETHTMTLSQLPTHNHAAAFTPSGGTPPTGKLEAYSARAGSDTPTVGDFLSGGGGTPIFGTGGLGAQLVELDGLTIFGGTPGGGTVAIGNAGQSRPFNIQGPVMALTYCIAWSGIYPPRD